MDVWITWLSLKILEMHNAENYWLNHSFCKKYIEQEVMWSETLVNFLCI